MLVDKINLYDYFGIEKPEGAKGIITIYCWGVSSEMMGNKRIRPAMLILPGGGYAFVSDRECEPIAIAYMEKGFNCFTLDYSVAPVQYPVQLREAAMAMIFIRENSKKYHVDPEHVSAIGFSAGGHLCASLGVMFNCEDIRDLRNYDFVRPTAVVLSYPVSIYGDSSVSHTGSFECLTGCNKELSSRLSIDKMVTKLSSPAFIWHTYKDSVVPVIGSLKLAEAYNNNKVPFEMHIFENGDHGLSLATEETLPVAKNVQPWFELSIAWLRDRGFNIIEKK